MKEIRADKGRKRGEKSETLSHNPRNKKRGGGHKFSNECLPLTSLSCQMQGNPQSRYECTLYVGNTSIPGT